MVLQKNDGFLVQISRNLFCLGVIDELMPLALWSSGIGIFEEAHFELDPEQPGYCSVDERNIQLSRLDKLWDFLEITLWKLVHARGRVRRGLLLQGTTSHLDVNASGQQLLGDRSHIDGVTLAHLERIA
jgi:hypothetical protein